MLFFQNLSISANERNKFVTDSTCPRPRPHSPTLPLFVSCHYYLNHSIIVISINYYYLYFLNILLLKRTQEIPTIRIYYCYVFDLSCHSPANEAYRNGVFPLLLKFFNDVRL